ncbi:arylsulfatase [Variovorax sp. CF079]|uniref:arylsulfatase n=1 Tax=Variovorax sp. CF079 TaxID=1882774 RepID=UPI000B8049A4|nr:arylsulfatase [Variovorax sp. CF079]
MHQVNQGRGKWPASSTSRKGAPNVIVVLTDDVGYGACSTFGGPIATENLDALALGGLRFTQFHTTAMCSPTRAALLTGRNPHRVSMGRVTARPSYYDGYTSVIPKSAGTIADVLRAHGYSTAMFGKGHITPEWEMGPLGPYDRWPTGMGFDYFYGFLGFDTNMWSPDLVENTSHVQPPRGDTRHFDEIMADRAIDWIAQQKAVAPEKPFFVYYATGTAHSPHHAPQKWLQKYRGKFDIGWDAVRSETFERQKASGVIPESALLTPRPDNLPAWASLSAQQKALATRLMEAYAAALDHFDYQFGRVVQTLKDWKEFDNTLILFIQGDNGGSAEGGFNGLLFEQSWANGFDEKLEDQLELIDKIGGPDAYNHFPAAWGWAINSPFQYYKQVASHFGGTRNGLVVSWPSRLSDRGSIRTQFHHVVDVHSTVLAAAGIEPPKTINGVVQDSLDGVSMLYAFDSPEATSSRKTQIFESMQNFGIYHDGWMACTTPENDPWESFALRRTRAPDDRRWELYDLRDDYSQSIDLANQSPQKLQELKELFWMLAAEGKILPIHSPTEGAEGRPSHGASRNSFKFRRRLRNLHADAAPHTVGRSFRISCDVVVGANGGHGVLACHGSSINGYAFYFLHGVPVFYYNAIFPSSCSVTGVKLSPGRHTLIGKVDLDERKPGSAASISIEVDGFLVATGRIDRTLKSFLNQNGFNIGGDSVSPVSPDYRLEESEFDGELPYLIVDLD